MNGTERLGWTHELPPGIAIGGVEFNAYVDNARKPLTDVSCTAQSQTLYDCAAPLPDMPDGRHELRMTSVHRVSGKMVESTKSAPLAVVKVPASTAVPSSERRELAAMVTVPPPAQTGFTSRIVAAGTGAIADLAVAGDGRVFAAERGGRVLVLDSARGPGAATALHLEDLETTGNRGLFSIALHPDFTSNGLIYFAYAAQRRDGAVYRLARGREVGGRIGEMAVLLDAAPAPAHSWAIVRFGPDRRLYVALGDDPDNPAPAASYNGKLLRLNGDGTAAADNPGRSPIVADVPGVPSGLAWTADARVLQFAASERHAIRTRGADGGATAHVWDVGRRPAAIAYSPPASGQGARGELLVAMLDAGVERIEVPSTGLHAVSAIDKRVAQEYGAVRALAAAPDGSIYIGTANADALPEGAAPPLRDFVVRLAPRAADDRP